MLRWFRNCCNPDVCKFSKRRKFDPSYGIPAYNMSYTKDYMNTVVKASKKGICDCDDDDTMSALINVIVAFSFDDVT